MAEYVGGEPMAVGVGDPITFENKTDDSFIVAAGIVFRKSGLYRVTIAGKHTSVEIEPERKKSRWVNVNDSNVGTCASCLARGRAWMNFCHNCGADMKGEQK